MALWGATSTPDVEPSHAEHAEYKAAISKFGRWELSPDDEGYPKALLDQAGLPAPELGPTIEEGHVKEAEHGK